MSKRLHYDKEQKVTFMKENINGYSFGSMRYCMNCKRPNKYLYRYWYEPDIGGNNEPPRNTLPFCSIKCYRKYNSEEIKHGR